jgi:hypothetical protein
MMESRISEAGILTVEPRAALEVADFQRVTAEVDGWRESGRLLQGILIDAPSFPGWKDFEALLAHLRFVRDHHRSVHRVAMVTDTTAMALLPRLASHFVVAELRHFPANQRLAAVDWLEQPVESSPRHLSYSWFEASKVVMMSVDGKITTAEYKEFLAWFEGIIAGHSPVSCVINLDNFDGAEFGAAMEDLKFGVTHLSDVRRMALMGDQKWIRRAATIPLPIEIRVFEDGDEQAAWKWASS